MAIRINPSALVFWTFAGLVGYLVDGQHGAIIGVTVTMGISILISLITK